MWIQFSQTCHLMNLLKHVSTAFEIWLSSWQMPRLLPRHIYVFEYLPQQKRYRGNWILRTHKKIFSKNKAEIRTLVNKLFKSNQTVSGLNKQQDLEMLLLTTKKKNLFDQKYYSQTDGVIMGSLLGSTLTNVIT